MARLSLFYAVMLMYLSVCLRLPRDTMKSDIMHGRSSAS